MLDSEDYMTVNVEVHDKRFGVIAVEKEFITKEQLFEALKLQGGRRHIGKASYPHWDYPHQA